MEKVKIVVRYADGRVAKGFTQDFFPNKFRFHLFPKKNGSVGESTEIQLRDLKAVFFVKDFDGNAEYNEQKQYEPGARPTGRIVQVTFNDGEVLVGSTFGYDANRPGFFFFPADPRSNNLRVYAVTRAVRIVRYI
jgi:hypothetical protein